MAVRIQEAASHRLVEVYSFTRERWGEAQAGGSITGLFEAFEQIETHGIVSRPIPAEFCIERFFFRYERHVVYWHRLSNADVGIVAILHQRMHQMDRFRDDVRA